MIDIKMVEGFMSTSSARFATLAGSLFAAWGVLPDENKAALLALMPANVTTWAPSLAMFLVLFFRGTSIKVGQ